MSIMTNVTSNPVLDILRTTYQSIFISAVHAGREIGFADKTTRNMLSESRFPIPTTKICGKRVVSILVLADYIIQQSQHISPTMLSPQVRKGRPPNSTKFKDQSSHAGDA
ncbi:MAG: hypothetical protein HOP25_01925 [Methylotenera sp.]|nr:hypothetical protein [Methylotenera sp.]